jgi:hypothetical protein
VIPTPSFSEEPIESIPLTSPTRRRPRHPANPFGHADWWWLDRDARPDAWRNADAIPSIDTGTIGDRLDLLLVARMLAPIAQAARTDTMILLSVDVATGRAGDDRLPAQPGQRADRRSSGNGQFDVCGKTRSHPATVILRSR